MTQQDETAHDAAAEQSAPSYPSPYLEASEAPPQAYLAPPQPGQPRYGMPAQFRGSRPSVRPGSGQQRDYGQAGRGKPDNRHSEAPVRRDPALADPTQRLVASFVDWFVIIGVSSLLYWSSLLRILHEWEAVIGAHAPVSPAAHAALTSLLADPSNQRALVYWRLTIFGFALAYFWIQHAACGATLGKLALGLRLVEAEDKSRVRFRVAGIRAATFLAGPAMLVLLPPIGVLGAVLWIADGGLTMLDPRAQSLHDKLAGTVVVRGRWLRRQARRQPSSNV